MKNRALISFLSLLFLLALADQADAKAKVKHIIVMISDGWGYNQIAATNYWNGADQEYEHFPVALGFSTYSIDTIEKNGSGYDTEQAWSDFDYVKRKPTDSAAAATAMSTGVKTMNGHLGVDKDKKKVQNIIERAEEIGWSTGVVSSVMFSHATPAGYVAHNKSRNNYEEIALEMIEQSACEVIMGPGHPLYDDNGLLRDKSDRKYKYVGGKDLWEKLSRGQAGGDCDGDGKSDPWKLIETKAQFEQLICGQTPERVIGVPQVYKTLQCNRDGGKEYSSDNESDNEDTDLKKPYTDQFIETVPLLKEMTQAALNVLDNNEDGFFLMVEGGAVDWANHSNLLDRMIEEQDDFNAAVRAVQAWVTLNSNWDETLLVVTGDHECGYLMGTGCEEIDGDDLIYDVANAGPGNLPAYKYYSDHHTNSIIPFYAKGFGSAMFVIEADEVDVRRGPYLDNVEMAKVIFTLIRD